MRWGISLPTYPAGATPEGVVAVTQAAERLGFDSAWVTDHVIMLPEEAGPYGSIFEPLVTLGFLAGQTERITLGISVIVVPQRNGIVLAKELATLDQLSDGRIIAGVGAGWSENEFRMLGYADRFHQRGAFLDETLAVWRHLWTTPEQPFRGHFYDLPPVAFGPLPVQPGGPPIWVGGASEAACRRAGRVAAAWHPVNPASADLRERIPIVRAAAEAAGRPAPSIAPRLSLLWGTRYSGPVSAGGARGLRAESSAELAEKLQEYVDAGADQLVVHFGSPDGQEVVGALERFAAEVLPHVGAR